MRALSLFGFGLFGFALVCAACADLTEPPAQEQIVNDPSVTATTAGSASAKPAASAQPIASAAPTATASSPPVPTEPEKPMEKTDLVVGKGQEAKTGDTVSVHYLGTLTNGEKFDASRDHGQPFQFKLGAGRVIRGWDQGVVGMKIGGKRKLVIPPSLGYGARGAGGKIPPNSTLVFEIDLLEIKS